MKKKIDIEIIDKKQIPQSEPERQYYFMDIAKEYLRQLSEEKGSPLTFHVSTFGCQMNARDSEKLVGILEKIGFVEEGSEEADFVIYNTCTVRENANNKVYGRLGYLNGFQKKNPFMMIGLCGCMMQEPTVVEKIQNSYRFVDLIFGTHNIYKFPELLVTMFESDRMVIDIWKDTDQIVENLPVDRKYPFKSGINIMFGCDNFCSYCIVPYVRGREKSREPKDILREIESLVADGVVEVMLLGQNVNSYGKNLENPISFAQLLREVEKIEGLQRIRFMTSHPKDLSDELIEVMRDSKKICRHLHLPLQSGSTRILKAMNRKYTKESYLALVDRIRKEILRLSVLSMGKWIQGGERTIFETVISVEATDHSVLVPTDEADLDGLNFLAGKHVDEVNKMAELGTQLAHVDGGVPNIKVTMPEVSAFYIGQLFYFFEKACGISGYMLGVNPFNQPGVEAYKKNMFALLNKPGYEKESEAIKARL